MEEIGGDVEWLSLGDILKRLYLEKRNDNGSIDVKMFGNNLILENQSAESQSYHVIREEDFYYPFQVFINGQAVPSSTTDQELIIDLTIPPFSNREILIVYYPRFRVFLPFIKS